MTRLGDTASGTGHFVQELGLDHLPGDAFWAGDASVPPGALAEGTGFPLASVLISYADVIAGSQVRAMTLPQMSVTVDLCLDVTDPDAVRQTVTELAVESRMLRAGRRSYVTQTDFFLSGRRHIAVCTGSFAALSLTSNALGDEIEPPRRRHERPLLGIPLAERVGLEVVSAGHTRLERRPDLGNSTNSLMGGLTALLGEAAAISAAEDQDSTRYLADRLHIRYLAPIRVGPAEARVDLLAGASGRRLVRVCVRDTARPAERAADVTVGCAPLA